MALGVRQVRRPRNMPPAVEKLLRDTAVIDGTAWSRVTMQCGNSFSWWHHQAGANISTDSFFLHSYLLKNISSLVINAIKHAGAEAASKLEWILEFFAVCSTSSLIRNPRLYAYNFYPPWRYCCIYPRITCGGLHLCVHQSLGLFAPTHN